MRKKSVLSLLLLFIVTFSTGCGEKTIICSDIPDAENTVFTDDGQLFVSGAQNLYRVNKMTGNSYTAEALLDESAGINGLAVYDDYLYAVYSKFSFNINYFDIIKNGIANGDSFSDILDEIKSAVTDKKIIVADLTSEPVVFNDLCTLDELLIPNGLAIDSSGRLYITDETFIPRGKILRVTIDGESVSKELWMTPDTGAVSPNGIAIRGDVLYFTDLDLSNLISPKALVKRVDIDQFDNNIPEAVTELYKRPGGLLTPFSLFDDLTTGAIRGIGGVVVTDYNHGTLLFIEDKITAGELHYETDKGLFASPSSVIRGTGPDFSDNQLLVTEKGLLMVDPYSDFGNKLVSIDIE